VSHTPMLGEGAHGPEVLSQRFSQQSSYKAPLVKDVSLRS
jgi:hypothetical protein